MLPFLSPYSFTQRKRTLTKVNWASLVASLLLTLYNIPYRSTFSLASLAILDLFCVIALVLNYHDHYFAAAVMISVMALVAITLNVYDGDGLFDSGVIAYPIYIILGSLLFGKRSVLGFSLSSLVSLAIISILQSRGLVDVTVRALDISNAIPITIFITIAGVVVWVIMSNMENNLDQIQKDEANLRTAYEKTLYGWAKALEYRDKETEGHSQRVVYLSQKLAKALGCTENEIQNIRQGAILHDIGKMGIPDQILLKPGPLDALETEIMHRHPQYGKEILAGIDFLQPAVSIVYNHHERWDGCGYPQGVRGKEIPLPARIFTIIDIWDALHSDRPYRKAWPQEKVIEYIRENSGKIFDPEITDVFLAMDKS